MMSPAFSAPVSPAAQATKANAAGIRYRVLKKATLKAGAALDSSKCGSLKPGCVVEALQADGNRIRTAHGWLSIVASSGTKLLEAVEPQKRPAAAAAAPPRAAAPAAAAPAQWVWELKKWEKSGVHGEQQTKPFEVESSAKLEAAYRAHCAGGPGSIKLVLTGSEYKIDFRRMQQVNAKTGFERGISRRGPDIPRTAASVPQSPATAAPKRPQAAQPQAASPAPAAASPAAGLGATPAQTGRTSVGASPSAAAAPLPRITLYLNKGRSSTVWMCRLLNRGSQLGYFVETKFGRALPMSKCLGVDTTKGKAKLEGTKAPSAEAGKQMMRELATAKMQRGYTKAPPPDVQLDKLPHFFEIGLLHKCGSCQAEMQATERCERLQCPQPGCEVFASAAEVARKQALEEERRAARAKERAEAVAKARKYGTGFATKRDGGEQDLKAIKWFNWGLSNGDAHDVVLQSGLEAATARVKIVKCMARMEAAADPDCKDISLAREALAEGSPLVKAALGGPVQNLPFHWLVGADAVEKREAAFDKMRRQLKTLHRHAKNLQATLKREAAAKLQAEAKAAREAAAKRLGMSRCYKCNWPGKPGDNCPNCSTGDDVVALPSAPARSAGGGGVRFSSSRSGQMICEYAKSGRSKCHGTGELIPQDELRIGILEFSDTAGRVVPRWFHIDAFFEYADIDGSLTDPSNIEGYDMLRQYDQDLLRDEIGKLVASGGGNAKKRKAKVLSGDGEDSEEDPIEEDEDWQAGNDDAMPVDEIEEVDLSGAGPAMANSPWPLKVGDVVRLQSNATEYEGGPLEPGNTGIIADVSDDADDEEPYQVSGKNGQTWWYEVRHIEKV